MQSVAGNESGGAGIGGPPMERLEDLVRAMADGNRAALSRVYEQTVGQVYAISRAVLRCKEDAEEVVCDVYTSVWQRAASYDATRGTVMAWLAVMTRNRAVDRIRQRREAVSLDDDRNQSLVGSLVGETLGPEEVLAQFQAGSEVHEALRSLSPQRRHLLGLAFFQGLSHQEIADVTHMPLGTVKSHLRRALTALQGELAADR